MLENVDVKIFGGPVAHSFIFKMTLNPASVLHCKCIVYLHMQNLTILLYCVCLYCFIVIEVIQTISAYITTQYLALVCRTVLKSAEGRATKSEGLIVI